MHSIKTKLIAGLSVFVIFLFSVAAFLLIDEKKRELSRDIYTRARSVSELTTNKIVDLYTNYLAENAFVIFSRELKDVFLKSEDISYIKLYTFGGEVLYDSVAEKDRLYEGQKRNISDLDVIARIKANLPSYLLQSGVTVYLKKDKEGNYLTVNENENQVADVEDTDEIINIVYPFEGKYAVEFGITYENLRTRVVRTTERIVLLLIFGVLLGLGFGWFFASRITTPIEQLSAGALVIGKGDFSARVNVKTHDEVGMLANTFNKMAQDLETSTKALVYKERVAKELELAAKMQKQILPKEAPTLRDLDVAAALVPAVEIGGDCYDFIQVAPDHYLIYIGDVTGHGVPSGIVVSIANALLYSYAKAPNISEILVNANRVLKEKTTQNMFMTLLMVRYAKGQLSYVSAGHPEMLHYYASEKKVSIEKGGGIALGMVADISKMLNETHVLFSSGDSIILYSDGIPEAVSKQGEQYGLKRLKRILNDAGELPSAQAICTTILADVKAFIGGAQQMDDITLVVLQKR